MTIRFAKEDDIEHIIELCKLHADYEKVVYNAKNKAEVLSKHLFGSEPVLKCFIVELNAQIVGYATFMKQFSTWNANFYLYLDCLFLKEETRGKGIGMKIMAMINDYAKANSYTHIEWQTPDFNDRAISFYNKIGASSKTKERFFW